MSETHISYEVSKRLKEFLGDSAPEPICKCVWICGRTTPVYPPYAFVTGEALYPAYQLHDLLSKPFCEAMAKALSKTPDFNTWVFGNISEAYWYGGLPAVERTLTEMMK